MSDALTSREEIAGAPMQMFLFLFSMGEVAEDWRWANVVPLFKKPENCSLVNLTSIVQKLLWGGGIKGQDLLLWNGIN